MARLKAISNDEWKELATRLPIGTKRRGFHECQTSFNKTSFEYGRTATHVWCKCHRCGYSRGVELNGVVYRPAEPNQVAVPNDLQPITELIAKYPHVMLNSLRDNNLLPYLILLQASERYGRIYLPDDSGSYCGLDFTGKQFIPWRSPFGHMMAFHHEPDSVALCIEHEAAEYLQGVREGISCAFVPSATAATCTALTAIALAHGYKHIVINHHPESSKLKRELAVVGAVAIMGG